MAIEFDNDLTPSESDFLQVLRGTTDVDGKLESASSAGIYPVSELIEKIVTDIGSDYLEQSDIYNGLDSEDTTKALGAEQGKALKNAIDVNATNITKKADQSTTYTKTEVNDIADDKVNTSDIYDGLDSTSIDVPLSANRGKELDERVTTNTTNISTNATNIAKKANTYDVADALALKANQTDLETTNTNVSTNATNITLLENKLLGTEYGIMINETTGEVTRTGSAVGMNFGTPDGVNPIETDFDDVSIWRNMHAVKVSLDGVVKEPTEDGYDSFDGSSMISIPEGYYIKDERVDGYRYISICDKQIDSKYYPIKVKYLPCMLASDDGNGNLVCKPDLPPRKNISYNTANSIIKAQGDGNWVMFDTTGSYLKWALSCIEAGSTDHKTAYGLGIQSGMPYSSTGYDIKVASTGNTVVVDSSKPFYVGMMVQVGTAYSNSSIASDRYITDIVDNGDGTQTLTLDGDSFSVSVGDTCVTWAQPIPQAQYDVMKNGSGYILQFGSKYRSHVFYRGMPLHGNQWVLTDGFRRYDGEYYGCADPQYYGASDVRTSEGWTDLGYNIQSDNGYQKIRECVKIDDGFVDVPIEWGSTASSNTFYSAYLYNFNESYMGDRVLLLGGDWSYGSLVSPVCSNGNSSPSSSDFIIGCGLIRY